MTAVCEDVDKDGFDVEARRMGDGGELRASTRNRARSLSDKPTGTTRNPSCGKSGDTVGSEEDRRRSAIISASGSPITEGCCSAEILESRVASEEFGSKGVTIICGPASMKSIEKDKTDLGLDRPSLCFRFLLC
jgi:hypothetical protein